MTSTKNLRTKAWMLRGIGSVPGTLSLSPRRLSFTAHGSGNLWGGQLRRLEADAGRAGLAKQLDGDERAVVFDVPLSEVQDVHFPWYYFSAGFKVSVNGVRYRFGFDKPANTRFSDEGGDVFGEISRARRKGKTWRNALLGTVDAR